MMVAQKEQLNLRESESAGGEHKAQNLTFFDMLHLDHSPQVDDGVVGQDILPKAAFKVLAKQPLVSVDLSQGEKGKEIEQAPKNNAVSSARLDSEPPALKPFTRDIPTKEIKKTNKPSTKLAPDAQNMQEKKWAIQVGSFENGAKALLLRKALEKQSFDVFTQRVEDQKQRLFRVMVSAISEQEAQRLVLDLKSKGYEAAFSFKLKSSP